MSPYLGHQRQSTREAVAIADRPGVDCTAVSEAGLSLDRPMTEKTNPAPSRDAARPQARVHARCSEMAATNMARALRTRRVCTDMGTDGGGGGGNRSLGSARTPLRIARSRLSTKSVRLTHLPGLSDYLTCRKVSLRNARDMVEACTPNFSASSCRGNPRLCIWRAFVTSFSVNFDAKLSLPLRLAAPA